LYIGGPRLLASVASGVVGGALAWSALIGGFSRLAPGAVSNHSANFFTYGRCAPATDILVHIKLTKEVWVSDCCSTLVPSKHFTVLKVVRRGGCSLSLGREDGRCCDGERQMSRSRLGERMFVSLNGVLLLENWWL